MNTSKAAGDMSFRDTKAKTNRRRAGREASVSDSAAAVPAHLVRLANLMDGRYRIPLTGWRMGLDSILGFIPGVGDSIGAIVSLYIVGQAWRAGASKGTVGRMLGNLGADFAIGLVPVVGDLFDIGWRANMRNVKLLAKDLEKKDN
ncbi:MAG: DUF4112 domain-containing protein [Pseudomonadota bacterium]|nr:DUF4112 domain-containing protein [Pseudomonadota bacterium]